MWNSSSREKKVRDSQHITHKFCSSFPRSPLNKNKWTILEPCKKKHSRTHEICCVENHVVTWRWKMPQIYTHCWWWWRSWCWRRTMEWADILQWILRWLKHSAQARWASLFTLHEWQFSVIILLLFSPAATIATLICFSIYRFAIFITAWQHSRWGKVQQSSSPLYRTEGRKTFLHLTRSHHNTALGVFFSSPLYLRPPTHKLYVIF